MGLVKGDELGAELRFENLRQHDDGRRELKSGETRGRRQAVKIGSERDDVAAVLLKGNDLHHPQHRVERVRT